MADQKGIVSVSLIVLGLVVGFLAAFASSVAASAAGDDPLAGAYGAEVNPTGNPLGGGEGYSDLVLGGTYEVATAEELLAALRKAVAGDVVYVLPGARIDLTGMRGIRIPAGVTLAGNRGHNGSPGPLIFTNEYDTFPLLHAVGPNARITGLRIQGPDPDILDGAYVRPNSEGIRVSATVTIDNNEIYNWSYAGVAVEDGAQNVHIHHNTIHHVRRAGLGYPVVVNSGTALIEANVFDYYRHAIASTGYIGTGYEARYNLALPNATSHVFDMHGGADFCPKRSRPCSREEQLMAGEYVIIHHNTFQATNRLAIAVRGVPRERLEIYNNHFLAPYNPANNRGFNFVYYQGGNVRVYNNAYGPAKRVIGEEWTPDPLIREAGSGRAVAIAGYAGELKFGFINPPSGTTVPTVRGELSVEVAVDLGGAFAADRYLIWLDDELLYSGESAPGPGDVTIDTLALNDGVYRLTLEVRDASGDSLADTVTFRVDNWWTLSDPLRPPLSVSWFGNVSQDRTVQASAGWEHVTGNRELFHGDEDRKVPAPGTTQFLVWETPDLTEFTVTLYTPERSPALVEPAIELAVGADGEAWSWSRLDFEAAFEDPPVPGGWHKLVLKGAVPANQDVALFRLRVLEGSPLPVQVGHVEFVGRNR